MIMVKYLKAWKDYKNIDIKGMAITILVCNNFSVTENRDDISLLDTVTNIIDSLEDSFHCFKPVTPTDEDLFADRFPNGEDANKDISDKTVAPINLGNEDSHFA